MTPEAVEAFRRTAREYRALTRPLLAAARAAQASAPDAGTRDQLGRLVAHLDAALVRLGRVERMLG